MGETFDSFTIISLFISYFSIPVSLTFSSVINPFTFCKTCDLSTIFNYYLVRLRRRTSLPSFSVRHVIVSGSHRVLSLLGSWRGPPPRSPGLLSSRSTLKHTSQEPRWGRRLADAIGG